MLSVLQQAFTASGDPVTGHWTDDGGYAQTVMLRGLWGTSPAQYPEVAVYARRPDFRPSMAGAAGGASIGQGTVAVKGVNVLSDVPIACIVRTYSEDEREQLSDLIDETLWAGQNTAGVPWQHVIANQGVLLTGARADNYRELRQADDPAHGPIAYENTMVYLARAQFVYQPVVTALQSITLKATLVLGPGAQPLWTL